MEKNRIRPIVNGNSMRMSYSRQKEVLEMPNLIEVQKNSYKWFLEEGLKEAFDDISPITNFGGDLRMEFVDFELAEDKIKHTIAECKERDLTYEAPLNVKVRFFNENEKENLPQLKFIAYAVQYAGFEDKPADAWAVIPDAEKA